MEVADVDKELHFYDAKKIWMIVFFLAGIIVGTFCFNGLNSHEQTKIMIYSDYVAGRIKMDNVNKISLFRYVSIYRIKEILLLVIFGMTQYRFALHAGYIFYLGMKNSILLSIITATYGKRAIFYFVGLLLPQIFIYVYILCYIIKLFDLEQISYRSMGKTGKVIYITILYLLMCILEAFVNPFFISMMT